MRDAWSLIVDSMSRDACLEEVGDCAWCSLVVETRNKCDRPVTGKRRVSCTLKASSLAAERNTRKGIDDISHTGTRRWSGHVWLDPYR